MKERRKGGKSREGKEKGREDVSMEYLTSVGETIIVASGNYLESRR